MIHNKNKPLGRRPAAWLAALLAMLMVVAMPAPAMADSGVDASNWQGCITDTRADQAKRAGASFAFIKATEGAGYTDPQADCSMQGLKTAGVRRGVYHFARPDLGNSPEAEADWFNSQTRGYMHDGVIPVLDWEPGGAYNAWTWWALRWLQRVESAWGVKPMIYMSASVIRSGDWSNVAGSDYGLWVAGYPRGYAGERLRDPGNVPYSVAPWSFAAAWQYSSTGSVAGIGSAIDVNWFYGDAGTWARYAGGDSTPGTNANPMPAKPAQNPQQGAPTGDTDTLARAVIRGDYGNLPTRRLLLGNRYREVQDRVDQLLANTTPAGDTNGGTTSVTVQPGDTMSAIATRTGLWPLSAWQAPSGDLNRIWPGQVVTYNGGGSAAASSVPSAGRTVTVRAGDTLTGIAARLGIGYTQLTGYRSGDPNVIYPGEVLRY
ncbi:GH25 family lysozyme [Bifidobacterium scardovii]|uniref:Glycoside hydrolase family protein n=5 Tax=Bifidobacterium scardovii TaxID=158787 RepID=A0A087DGL8_9BIFI|nr:GH25 family lysozyme [Bifidobacterium scardovii]KFI94668.1 glycoside hydrolase family protein [Bifidobacterium scardovii]MDK6350707.1 GH25 family lysozyme [Bifidobacterium scardovii]BAQ32099.1 conserved hypothetical protein [Bifidobacterium scardovii JCM 12489 = DSM 13734]